MATIFGRKSKKNNYQISNLKSKFESPGLPTGGELVICDIDKTYLETNFETIVGIAKTALEDATEKETVAGAGEVLRSLYWASTKGPAAIHFVSASPPQMKNVLEKKLAIDRIPWQTATFKNQAYNLKKGRVSALKHHVVYKNIAILSIIGHSYEAEQISFIGDNAELDGYVYSGIKFLLDGSLSKDGYKEYVKLTANDPHSVQQLDQYLKITNSAKVRNIFIRKLKDYPEANFELLNSGIHTFSSFFKVYMRLVEQEVIKPNEIWKLTQKFHNKYGESQASIASALQPLTEHINEEIAQAAMLSLKKLTKTTPNDQMPQKDQLGTKTYTEEAILAAAKEWLATRKK